jgi:hypothetical protein
MPVPIESTLGMLADNLRKRRSALPIGKRSVTGWAKGLGIPRGGETVLYTGQMWQMVPTINAMSRQLGKYGESPYAARLFGFARSMNRIVNLTPLIAHASAKDRRTFEQRLRDIARLLRAADVTFGYLYEDDLYVGALAHDEGLDRGFLRHARYVHSVLVRHGVKKVITVDPHTTNILRTVYPKILPEFDIQVASYLEVLASHPPAARRQLGLTAAIHDSCIYARSEGVLEQPRRLLTAGGIILGEPDLSGKLTFCCGGPLETLFPQKSAEVARRRLQQLERVDRRVVTMCPLCLANLGRVAPPEDSIRDVSEYLADAFLPAEA